MVILFVTAKRIMSLQNWVYQLSDMVASSWANRLWIHTFCIDYAAKYLAQLISRMLQFLLYVAFTIILEKDFLTFHYVFLL